RSFALIIRLAFLPVELYSGGANFSENWCHLHQILLTIFGGMEEIVAVNYQSFLGHRDNKILVIFALILWLEISFASVVEVS
ncbi:1089_t:CDS:2, partial [Racocetra persica]